MLTITDEGRRRVASMEFAVSMMKTDIRDFADIAEEVLMGLIVAALCGFEWGGSNTPTPSELKTFLSEPEHLTEIAEAMKVVRTAETGQKSNRRSHCHARRNQAGLTRSAADASRTDFEQQEVKIHRPREGHMSQGTYESESPTAALAAEITDTILASPEWKRDDILHYIVGCLNRNDFLGNLDKVIAEIRSNKRLPQQE